MITGYQTGNVAIATMLYSLGVPFWKNDHGQAVPCFVRYDYDMLCKFASAGLPDLKDMDFDENAVRLAHRRGKKGNVRYNFERTELLAKLLKAWGKHEDWIAKATDSPPGDGTAAAKMEFPEVEPETAARLFCQYARNRSMMSNLWKTAPESAIMVDHLGKVSRSTEPAIGPKGEVGKRSIATGSFKSHSVNASAETKKRIGL